MRLANNILLAEFGTPLVHIQGWYLQRRCYSHMINYHYCEDHPWFGSIRGEWAADGMNAYQISSDNVMTTHPSTCISKGKELAAAKHYEE